MGGVMSSIVVSGDTSGAITIAAPAVAGTNTLTLPAATGTIITTASSGQEIPRAALPAGSVLQVVSATKTDSASVTSTTPTDITGLSVSITPTSSTSKILILATIYASANGSANSPVIYLVRNSTQICIGSGASGSRLNVTGEGMSPDANQMVPMSVNFLDSPSTASSITYKLQFGTNYSTSTVYVNRTYNNINDTYGVWTASTITVMEISA